MPDPSFPPEPGEPNATVARVEDLGNDTQGVTLRMDDGTDEYIESSEQPWLQAGERTRLNRGPRDQP